MKILWSWLLDIFACHTLLANPSLESDDANNTVKISAMITVCLPLLVVLGSFVAIYTQPSNLSTVKGVILVAVLLIYFGVSSVTDRVYDRNVGEIRARAEAIQSNRDQGLSWARGRLIRIYVVNFVAMAIIVILVKVLT